MNWRVVAANENASASKLVERGGYHDLPSLHRIQHEIRPPVLVVGAGQGLIVAAVQAQGLQCDGVDLSAEMRSLLQLTHLKRQYHSSAAQANQSIFG